MHLVEIDREIIHKAGEGSDSARESIFRVYAPVVYNISYRMTGTIDDADEVTREVFVNIFSKLKQFDIESSGFGMWVYRIAVNMSITQLSFFKKILDKIFTFEIPGAPEDSKSAVAEAKPEDSDVQNEEANRKLMNLPPKLRAVIVLREMEALSYYEIAKTLNISENTVKSFMKKARYKFLQQGEAR